MAIPSCRAHLNAYLRPLSRLHATTPLTTTAFPESSSTPVPAPSQSTTSAPAPPTLSGPSPNTHFKVTLRRSGISLGKSVQGTLLALGFHRRFQTVYHRHTPEAAGMILRVKELVEVENVPEGMVRTAGQQRRERKAKRGYKVVGSKKDKFMHV